MQKNTSKQINPLERVIIALDTPSVTEAQDLIKQLGDNAKFYKIGYELSLSGGLNLIQSLKDNGKKVFLDWKLHDINNTVKNAVIAASKLNVDLLTIHALPEVVKAAVSAQNIIAENNTENNVPHPLQLLGVTVLTSLTPDDLQAESLTVTDPLQLALLRARNSYNLGLNGFVCSPLEVSNIRQELGDDAILVTPGVRPAASDLNDQKRVSTPKEAIQNGADYLVIGRPITKAENPQKAFENIVEEIA